MHRILKLWHRLLRDIDMRILWPACRSRTPDLDLARAAFMLHASCDPA